MSEERFEQFLAYQFGTLEACQKLLPVQVVGTGEQTKRVVRLAIPSIRWEPDTLPADLDNPLSVLLLMMSRDRPVSPWLSHEPVVVAIELRDIRTAPELRLLGSSCAIFHPNTFWNSVCLTAAWRPVWNLAHIIASFVNMILMVPGSYTTAPGEVLNVLAARYFQQQNQFKLPLAEAVPVAEVGRRADMVWREGEQT